MHHVWSVADGSPALNESDIGHDRTYVLPDGKLLTLTITGVSNLVHGVIIPFSATTLIGGHPRQVVGTYNVNSHDLHCRTTDSAD